MTRSLRRQKPALQYVFHPPLLPAALILLIGMLMGAPQAWGAHPLQDNSLRAVQIPGVGENQDSGKTANTGSAQTSKPLPSQDAAAAAALEMPPKLPPGIGVTITHRQQRLFEEKPQRLRPPASEPPRTFALPPALQYSIPGAYGTAQVNLTPQALDNAQSQVLGNGVLIRNDTLINSIRIHNAQDAGHRNLGDIGVNHLQVQGTIKVTPSK